MHVNLEQDGRTSDWVFNPVKDWRRAAGPASILFGARCHVLERYIATSGYAVARVAALCGGYILLAFAFMVAVEVVGRKYFNFSLQAVDEVGGYVLAVTTAFALSYAFLRRAHTRVDLFIGRLSDRVRACFNALSAAATTAFAVFMAWRAAATLMESIALQSRASTPLQTPLWIPQSLWVAGLCFFAIITAGVTGSAVLHLIRGNVQQVNRFCGTASDASASRDQDDPSSVEEKP